MDGADPEWSDLGAKRVYGIVKCQGGIHLFCEKAFGLTEIKDRECVAWPRESSAAAGTQGVQQGSYHCEKIKTPMNLY